MVCMLLTNNRLNDHPTDGKPKNRARHVCLGSGHPIHSSIGIYKPPRESVSFYIHPFFLLPA